MLSGAIPPMVKAFVSCALNIKNWKVRWLERDNTNQSMSEMSSSILSFLRYNRKSLVEQLFEAILIFSSRERLTYTSMIVPSKQNPIICIIKSTDSPQAGNSSISTYDNERNSR